ncbi:MAG: hypothetical protein JWO23_1129, partial [Solirubrobacterales bacterium]|nr:hypothetical protein [Solirubrobacterales bacterium]
MNFAPAVMALLAVAVGGCGSQSNAAQAGSASVRAQAARARTAPAVKRASPVPVVKGPGQPGSKWRPVATIGGQPAAWIALRSGVTLLRF